MAILASEEKIRKALDKAFFLGRDIERGQRWNFKYIPREDLQDHFDNFVEELKTP